LIKAHGRHVLKNTESGLIKGLWNYGQALLVVENIDGRVILLDFPSRVRAIEYLCSHFKELKIPLKAFKTVRQANQHDLDRYNDQPKRSSPKKIHKKNIEQSVVDRYHKDMELEHFKFFLEENY
jgi:hypothetical protein